MSGKYIQRTTTTHKLNKLSMAAVIASGLLVASCGSDNGKSSSSNATAGIVSANWGESSDKAGNPFTFGGGAITQLTNQSGYARLTNLPIQERVVLRMGSAVYAYAPQTFVVEIVDGDVIDFGNLDFLSFANVEDTLKFKLSDGINQKNSQGATVAINANAFTTAGLTSDPIVYLASVDLKDTTNKYLPSDWKRSANDALQSLEPLAAVYLDVVKAEGADNNTIINDLKSGQTVSLSVPVTSIDTSALPQTIDAFYLDTNSGIWKKDSEFTLNAAKTAYSGKTRRAGYLAMMKPVTETVTLSGCVENYTLDSAGKKTYAKLPRTLVKLTGKSYSGYNQAMTDADGKFSITVKKGSDAELTYRKGQFTTTQTVTAASADKTVAGSAESNNGCMVLDTTGVSTNAASGKLTWAGSQDYDINIVTPNGDLSFYNKRELFNSSGSVLKVTENAAGKEESFAYSSLQDGIHLITVNNFNSNFNPSMSSAVSATTLTMTDKNAKQKVFKAVDASGEITKRDSKLVDRRTNVWLAAILNVKRDNKGDCTASIESPSASSLTASIFNSETNQSESKTLRFKQWMTDTELVAGKVFADDDSTTLSQAQKSTLAYCNSVSFN